MNTPKKTQTAIAATIAIADDPSLASVLTLNFANGQVIQLKSNELSPEMVRYAMMHGLKQKLVDAAAIARDPETGRSATISDKFAAVREVADRLLAGQWNATREGNGTGGLLYRALCRLYPAKTPEAIAEYLETKTEAEKTALRKNPKVAAIIEEIRVETGKAANIDTDAMLDELDD